MKQTTLPKLEKRPASLQLQSDGKRKVGKDGTQNQPIDLDAPDPPEDLEAIDLERELAPSGFSTVEELTIKSTTKEQSHRHNGPSTAHPLLINDPPFELGTLFTHVKPKVYRRDPDLDLLYFKTMSQCIQNGCCYFI